MSVPHLDRPICEPVELRPGARLRVRSVAEGRGAESSAPFPHYHDVCELVLFGRVRGEFIADGVRYPLSRGCLVFVPSLRQHDFALAGGARDWTLVQIDPGTVSALAGGESLGSAFCARPGRALAERIGILLEWLREAGEDDALAAPLAQSLLLAAAQAPRIAGQADGVGADALRRLRPAIERLRRDPANAPSAEQAAALCALSPAYFSRRFHQQLGMAWSDYVRTHRLHLASQRLRDGEGSVAEIAYALGFSTPSHFGEVFHRHFHATPAEYRRRGR